MCRGKHTLSTHTAHTSLLGLLAYDQLINPASSGIIGVDKRATMELGAGHEHFGQGGQETKGRWQKKKGVSASWKIDDRYINKRGERKREWQGLPHQGDVERRGKPVDITVNQRMSGRAVKSDPQPRTRGV